MINDDFSLCKAVAFFSMKCAMQINLLCLQHLAQSSNRCEVKHWDRWRERGTYDQTPVSPGHSCGLYFVEMGTKPKKYFDLKIMVTGGHIKNIEAEWEKEKELAIPVIVKQSWDLDISSAGKDTCASIDSAVSRRTPLPKKLLSLCKAVN